MKTYCLFSFFFFGFSSLLLAQAPFLYTQFGDQFHLDNPAALSREEMHDNGIFFETVIRKQWQNSGHPGAPVIGLVGFNSNKKNNWNYGGRLIFDKIGAFSYYKINGRLSRKLGSNFYLGTALGTYIYQLDLASLDIRDDLDPLAIEDSETQSGLLADIGLFYHFKTADVGGTHYFLGISGGSEVTFGLSEQLNNRLRLHFLGGIELSSTIISAKMSYALVGPDALSIYLRQYIYNQGQGNQFYGGIVYSSDYNHHLTGFQLGFSGHNKNNFKLKNVSIGASFPIASYLSNSFGGAPNFDLNVIMAIGQIRKNQ